VSSVCSVLSDEALAAANEAIAASRVRESAALAKCAAAGKNNIYCCYAHYYLYYYYQSYYL
jgi:hypothetical protein